MSQSLRPMTLGEILDRTFQIYRSRLGLCVGISALAWLGVLAIFAAGLVLDALVSQTTLTSTTKAYLESPGAIGADTWYSLCRFLVWPVFIVVASTEFFGKKAAFRPAIAECAERWRSWVAIGAALWAIWNGIPALIQAVPILERARMNAMLSFSSGAFTEWPRSLFYYWLGWMVSLAVSAALWIIVTVWTREDISIGKMFGRGWALARKAYGRIAITWLMTMLVEGALNIAISFVIIMAIRIFVATTGNQSLLAAFRRALSFGPGLTSSVVVTPLFPIALTLIYYDQRIRQEGFDIEMMMDAAGMNAAPEAAPEEATVPAGESGEQPA
jgi:hypothetical protein